MNTGIALLKEISQNSGGMRKEQNYELGTKWSFLQIYTQPFLSSLGWEVNGGEGTIKCDTRRQLM